MSEDTTKGRAAVIYPDGSDFLAQLGFTEREGGDWHAASCGVTFYAVGGSFEVDIMLPNGVSIGFDVPMGDVKAG
jgi:hypothetical protein